MCANLFAFQLCQLQLKDQPKQFISRVVGVEEQPEVLVHAVVHVQADHPQAWRDTDAVVGAVPGCIFFFKWEPNLSFSNFIVHQL